MHVPFHETVSTIKVIDMSIASKVFLGPCVFGFAFEVRILNMRYLLFSKELTYIIYSRKNTDYVYKF